MPANLTRLWFIGLSLVLFFLFPLWADDIPLPKILDGIEMRYDRAGFSARFTQESTIEAMDITDSASGRVWFRHPGKMRWEYEEPDRHVIITDGKELWIYRPDDNQVMIGSAASFFGNGKGVNFLSDIRLLREKFYISPGIPQKSGQYQLELVPREPSEELTQIDLVLSGKNFDILQAVTHSTYGDKTRIRFKDQAFTPLPEDQLFTFEIPPGVEVLRLEK